MNKIMQNTVLGLLILMAIGFVVVVAQRDLVVNENKEFQKEIVELKKGLSAGGTYVSYDLTERLYKCEEAVGGFNNN